MLLQIKYFGMLTEVTECLMESLEFSGTVDQLITELEGKYPQLKDKHFKVAINQEMVSGSTLIDGPEVALLPPFSGG